MARNLFLLLAFSTFISSSAMIVYAQERSTKEDISISQQPPPPPTGVRTTIRGKHLIVQWKYSSSPAVRLYEIFRVDNADPGNVFNIGSVARDSNFNHNSKLVEYIDKNVVPGHTYTYFLTAKDSFGLQSQNSNMAVINIQ